MSLDLAQLSALMNSQPITSGMGRRGGPPKPRGRTTTRMRLAPVKRDLVTDTTQPHVKVKGTHSIYVKNLSPLVTEHVLREIFQSVEGVCFQSFGQTNGSRRYAKVDFFSAKDVVEAMKLGGMPVLGVPMSLTVVNPHPEQTPEISQDTFREAHEINSHVMADGKVYDKMSADQRRCVERVERIRHAQMLKPVIMVCPITGEDEKLILQRTVCVENLDDASEDDLRQVFKVCGLINNMRLEFMEKSDDCDEKEKRKFALIEFSTPVEALKAHDLSGVPFRGNTIKVSPSLATVIPCQPSTTQFLPQPSFPVANLHSNSQYDRLLPSNQEDRKFELKTASLKVQQAYKQARSFANQIEKKKKMLPEEPQALIPAKRPLEKFEKLEPVHVDKFEVEKTDSEIKEKIDERIKKTKITEQEFDSELYELLGVV